MDTRLLRMFCSIARHGSLVAASRELHLTPSALSHALKDLETQIGCQLFHRTSKKFHINQAGEHLLTQVEGPLAALDDAEKSVKALKSWGQTRLRIGAAASACQHLIPPIVRELKKAFPRLSLQVESGDMPEMVELIQTNQVDVALGVQPERETELETRPVFRDELLFTFSSHHPWAQGGTLGRDELRTQPLILYQRASITFRIVEDYFKALDIVPSTVMEIGNIEAIKELVKLNLGVAVLAPWTADKELARGILKMRPLGPRAPKRQWVVASMKGRRLTLAEETFCRLCRTVTSGLRMDRRDVPAAKQGS